MITPGQKMDVRFRVKVVADGAPKEVEFAELLTRRTIVSVYMKNNTPTCDRQTESLRHVTGGLCKHSNNGIGGSIGGPPV